MRNNWHAFIVVVWFGLICSMVFPVLGQAGTGGVTATVSGRFVTVSGEPMDQARGGVFRAASDCPLDTRDINRVPEALAYTDSGGGFRFAISPGEYFLGGVGQSSLSGNAMMLDNKDFILALTEKGEIRKFFFMAEEENILGAVVMTTNDRDRSNDKCFNIKGYVLDEKGRPMSGIVVLAKNFFNDLRPGFVSLPTKSDGEYVIGLAPGKYILIARRQDRSFVRPTPGELFGVFGEEKPVGVGGKFINATNPKRIIEGITGDSFEGKDITVFVIPDPEKIKLERQES